MPKTHIVTHLTRQLLQVNPGLASSWFFFFGFNAYLSLSQTGKTVFLSYLLVHRLQERLVTIYCHRDGVAHVFNESGVQKVALRDDSHLAELDANCYCCALVNLGDRMNQAPEQFYPSDRRGRVVIATSPNADHLSNFSREHITSTYCMPTWNWRDVYCAR
jgi:hypothetical protein